MISLVGWQCFHVSLDSRLTPTQDCHIMGLLMRLLHIITDRLHLRHAVSWDSNDKTIWLWRNIQITSIRMSPTNKIKSTRSRPSACFVCLFECEEQAWRVFGQLLTHVSVGRFSQWQPWCIHNHSKKTRFVHHTLCISQQLFRLMRVIRSFNFRLSPRLTIAIKLMASAEVAAFKRYGCPK